MTRRSSSEDEAALLRRRAHIILDVFQRLEPSATWPRFRALTDQAQRLGDLRTINRELRGAMAALDADKLRELRQTLVEQTGPDQEYERDRTTAEKARARGRIRTEREYRAVHAYADSIAGDHERRSEFDALGALLDEYASRPAT